MDALTAARDVASKLGLDSHEAVLLRDLRTAVVHLAPAGVVARVAPAADEAVARREVRVTGHLAARGAPVAGPWSEPGPYLVADRVVTLWEYVDHETGAPADGIAAGRALRQVHDALADLDVGDLPPFPRLDEVRQILATIDVEPGDAAGLSEMLELAAASAATATAPVQVVHGDAWLGNVLRTPRGPVWSDFELACVGPRELDLACNETAAQDRGRTAEDDAFLAGYGDHDVDLRRALEPLEQVPLAARTFELAVSKPEYLEVARRRMNRALEGLRSRPRG